MPTYRIHFLGQLLIAALAAPVTSAQGSIYWTDAESFTLRCSDINGANIQTLLTGLLHPRGIDIDEIHERIFWADTGSARIRSCDLLGGNVSDIAVVTDATGHLALDVAGGKIYWTQGVHPGGGDRVRRANLDGSGVEDLVTAGLELPGPIALDLTAAKVYFADVFQNTIYRANLDGTSLEAIITGLPGANAQSVNGLALDVANDYLYFSLTDAHEIRRARLDGTEMTTLVAGLNYPAVIELDLPAGKLYWSEARIPSSPPPRIARCNLDGTAVETVVGVGGPFGVAVYRPTPPALTSISVRVSSLEGGVPVTIHGANFRSSTTVTVGGAALVGQAVVDDATITGFTPPAAVEAAADLVVATHGIQALLPAAIDYRHAALIVPQTASIGSNIELRVATHASAPLIFLVDPVPGPVPLGQFGVAGIGFSSGMVSIANYFGFFGGQPDPSATVSAEGQWSMNAVVPPDPALLGATLYGQAFAFTYHPLPPNNLFFFSNVEVVTIVP